ncbi:MAG: SMP-30/gluconolactonase/LRE family protein [Saprospiraceae bacterium]|nr:SMP-30/gluconolactonase/LRE family protein [Saprospiraceae bacterium]
MKELTVDGRRWTVNGATSWLPSAVHRLPSTEYHAPTTFKIHHFRRWPRPPGMRRRTPRWNGLGGRRSRADLPHFCRWKKGRRGRQHGRLYPGLAFSPGAKWLAICDLGKKCVWRLDLQTMKLERFADGAEGHKFNIPNYAVFDKQGNLYVSESGAFRQITGKVLKFSPNGSGTIWHDGGFNFANGMALGPEGKHLYIAVSFLPGVERVAILPDGSAGERSLVCTLPEAVPDGLAFDADGNLYVSCYSPNKIYKVTPSGEVTVFMDDWEAHTISNPTNIAFGGPNLDQLFAANLGRWHITKIDAGVRGLALASHDG